MIQNKFLVLIIFISTFWTMSCAHGPTKIYSGSDIDSLFLEKNAQRPIQITDETIIIDARSTFDFAVAHFPQAINFQWSDFVDTNQNLVPRIKKDLSGVVRRLALLGVSPQSQVVVVGNGLNGGGEEARLAWTLYYLGIFKVQVSEIGALGLRYSNLVGAPRPNSKLWEPQLQGKLIASPSEIEDLNHAKISPSTHLIDVRSAAEFNGNRLNPKLKGLSYISKNYDWKTFFTKKGRPNEKVSELLLQNKITKNDRILLICDNSLRSGAVAYALVSLGFRNVGLVSGGYGALNGD